MKLSTSTISVWLLLVFLSKLIPSDSWIHLHSHSHTIHQEENSHKLILDSEHHHCEDHLFFLSPFIPALFQAFLIKAELISKKNSNYKQSNFSKINRFHSLRGPPLFEF